MSSNEFDEKPRSPPGDASGKLEQPHKGSPGSHASDRSSSGSRDMERPDRHKSRDRNRDRASKDRDLETDRHRDRHHRDRDRDRDRHHRDRERDRDRDRHHRDSHRDHSERRDRDYDRRREDRHRRRSRSRSRPRSEHKSMSSERKRMSGFDLAPPAAMANPGQLPGLPMIPGAAFPNMLAGQFVPMMAMTQQATRHARRVYAGGLPPTANEQTVANFFNHVMAAIGGNTAGPGHAVVNVYINHEKKFAFVEMRSVEEASNAMALNGILFEGAPIKVKRPSDYNPSTAAALGPTQPNPNLNLGAVALSPGGSASGVPEGPDRIFVGGLPYYLTDVQVKALLESVGPLRGFDLVKDKETGNSKGYAFCVYQDSAMTEIACAVLNGFSIGDKKLTVNQGMTQTKPAGQESLLLHAQQQISLMHRLMVNPTDMVMPTKVLCLTGVATAEELKDDEEFLDILDDMKSECGKFGNLVNVVIPRPYPNGEMPAGVGKVFLEYNDAEGSSKARQGLNGRKFGGNEVVAVFYPEQKFREEDYSG